MNRREFTLEAALAVLSGTVITISGCGGGGGSPTSGSPTGGPNASGDMLGAVSANHGHTAVITAAQLVGGNAIVLDISGTAGHSHTVELSAAEIAAIRGGTVVEKPSTTGEAHSHSVAFNRNPSDPTRY